MARQTKDIIAGPVHADDVAEDDYCNCHVGSP